MTSSGDDRKPVVISFGSVICSGVFIDNTIVQVQHQIINPNSKQIDTTETDFIFDQIDCIPHNSNSKYRKRKYRTLIGKIILRWNDVPELIEMSKKDALPFEKLWNKGVVICEATEWSCQKWFGALCVRSGVAIRLHVD